MGIVKDLVVGTTASLAAAAGISGIRLYSLSRNLQISHKLKVSNLSLKGITLTIDVVLKNPTGSSMKIQYPFLSVKLGDTLLASSVMKEDWIEIKPYSLTEIKDINFNLSILDELSIASNLLVPLTTGQPATIKAVTQTRVKFLFFHIPFTTEEDLVLNNNNGSKNA